MRYRRWQDRQAGLFGKLLLIEGLKNVGLASVSLDELKYNEFGRPFLNRPGDFNISHSGGYVLCAVAEEGKVGIDIEKIRSISLTDFKAHFRSEEWREITESLRPSERFFEYWTLKESIIKANGNGLSIPLTEILHHDNKALLYSESWYVRKICIDKDYKCHLATNLANLDLSIFQTDLRQLEGI